MKSADLRDRNGIEAFAANGADDALGEGVLPRSAWCDDDLADAHALDAALKVSVS